MSRFPEFAVAAVLALLLAACSSVPEPAPAPLPEPEPEPRVVAPAEASTALETANPQDPSEVEPEAEPEPVDFNQQFYQQAVAAMKSGDLDSAIDLLRQVSSEAPEKPFVFTNLGLAYFKLQQPELAEQAFVQAIERNGEDAVAHNHLGILQRRKGEFQAARDSYQQAIDSDPNYAAAYLNLGILFDIYLQRIEIALGHYRRYQSLIGTEDAQVAGWIVDIERRLKSGSSG